MSNFEENTEEGEVENESTIEFRWEKVPRGKILVKAHHDDELFHCHAFSIIDDQERARFRKRVSAIAKERLGIEVDANDLEPALLCLIEEIASQPDEVAAAPVE